MTMITTVTSKGQVTIPKSIRDQLNIAPFDQLIFSFKKNKLEATKIKKRSLMDAYGMLRNTGLKVTKADMKRAVAEGIVEKFKRNSKNE
jgi:antitoxin PrlF